MRVESARVDGVLVALDTAGRPARKALTDGEGAVLCFYAFDLVYFDDYDLRPLSLLDRKAALRHVLPVSAARLFADHVVGRRASARRARPHGGPSGRRGEARAERRRFGQGLAPVE